MITKNTNQCRKGCAACCIVISISSPLPGMPNGKPAGVPCIHLDEKYCCKLHNEVNYPEVCRNFAFDPEFCGASNSEAFERLSKLEMLTSNER
jgi:hypothetical protein